MDVWLPALFGLVGVLLGALLAGGFELYRRALDAQSAARLIRAETIDNRTKVEELLAARPIRTSLEATAWRDFRQAIAPFLDEVRLIRLAQSYAEMRDFQLIRIESTGHLGLDSRDRAWVEGWSVKVREQARWLREIEARNPWVLAASLFQRKRVATKDEIREAYRVTDEVIQAHDTDMKQREAALNKQQR